MKCPECLEEVKELAGGNEAYECTQCNEMYEGMACDYLLNDDSEPRYPDSSEDDTEELDSEPEFMGDEAYSDAHPGGITQ